MSLEIQETGTSLGGAPREEGFLPSCHLCSDAVGNMQYLGSVSLLWARHVTRADRLRPGLVHKDS